MIKKNIFFIIIVVMLFSYASYIAWQFYGQTVAMQVAFIPDANERCEKGTFYNKNTCEGVAYLLRTYDRFVPDALTSFNHIVNYYDLRSVQTIFPIFLMLMCVFKIAKEYKSIYPKMYLQRNTYRNYIKSLFKRTYKYILIYPALILYIFILCCLISRNFNFQLSADLGYELVSVGFQKNVIMYLIFLFVDILLLNSIYISLALIYIKKFSNSILTAIVGYLTFLGIEIFNEGVIEILLFRKVFNINADLYFNMLNITDVEGKNILIYTFILLLYSLIIFIIMLLSYKNKEKLIMNLEKNK